MCAGGGCRVCRSIGKRSGAATKNRDGGERRAFLDWQPASGACFVVTARHGCLCASTTTTAQEASEMDGHGSCRSWCRLVVVVVTASIVRSMHGSRPWKVSSSDSKSKDFSSWNSVPGTFGERSDHVMDRANERTNEQWNDAAFPRACFLVNPLIDRVLRWSYSSFQE